MRALPLPALQSVHLRIVLGRQPSQLVRALILHDLDDGTEVGLTLLELL